MVIDDRIGWSMKAIRAIEKGYRGVLLRCIRAYQPIGQMVNPYANNIRSSPGFAALRDHAVRLARESLEPVSQCLSGDECASEFSGTACLALCSAPPQALQKRF